MSVVRMMTALVLVPWVTWDHEILKINFSVYTITILIKDLLGTNYEND